MSEAVIRIMCPKLACRRVLAVPASARGKVVKCRECGTNVRIPNPTEAPATHQPGSAAEDVA